MPQDPLSMLQSMAKNSISAVTGTLDNVFSGARDATINMASTLGLPFPKMSGRTGQSEPLNLPPIPSPQQFLNPVGKAAKELGKVGKSVDTENLETF